MLKNLMLLIFILSLSLSVSSQNLQWAKRMGSTSIDAGNAIAVDASGKIYTAGYFRNTVDFDPGPGVFNLIASDGFYNVFISKLDAAGNFVWAKSFVGSFSDAGAASIAVDGTGNIYTTGYFSSQVDFDPAQSTQFYMTSAGSYDIFISKLNSFGNFVWAKRLGGSGVDQPSTIAVDLLGNVYTSGFIQANADLDPGLATYFLPFISGNSDVFISKLDTSGNFVWGKGMGGSGNDQGNSITIDALGDVYTTGYFSGSGDFDPSPGGLFNLSSTGGNDIFILKLTSAGNFLWAKKIGSPGADQGNSIAVDVLGNVYTTGFFTGTADFDPNAANYNLTSASADIFISKLNAFGNFVWAKSMGNISQDMGYGIAVDNSGNVYTSGFFVAEVDFDPGAGIYKLTPPGYYDDIFILKLDASGNFIWAKNMGGTDIDRGFALAVDAVGNVYSTGYFYGTADFDPDAGEYNLTSVGNSDIFIVKLSQNNLPLKLLSFEISQKENDACLLWKTLTESNTDKFELQRSIDGIVFSTVGKVMAAGNSAITISYQFTDKNAGSIFSNQNIFYRFKQWDLDGRFTYSPVRSINFIHKNKEVIVYPNPTKNNLTIKATAAQIGSFYIITDQLGRQVERGKLVKISNTINLSQVAAGIYYLKVAGATTQTFEIVKQ